VGEAARITPPRWPYRSAGEERGPTAALVSLMTIQPLAPFTMSLVVKGPAGRSREQPDLYESRAGGALKLMLAMDAKSRHLIEAVLVVAGLVAAIVLIYGLGGDIISSLGV